jgi:hypothetical protein
MITEASVEGLELLESLLKSIKEMKRMANYCYSIETREEVGKLLKVIGDFRLSDLLLKRETTTQRDVP